MEKKTLTLTPEILKALKFLKELRQRMRDIPTYLLYLKNKK